MALLVNAGEGIDVDLFLERQPKERMMQKIGQQIRINRSKIKDASDTNSDFDDLSNAIRSDVKGRGSTPGLHWKL